MRLGVSSGFRGFKAFRPAEPGFVGDNFKSGVTRDDTAYGAGSKSRNTILRVPIINQDRSFLGSILGSPSCGKLAYRGTYRTYSFEEALLRVHVETSIMSGNGHERTKSAFRV